ncbi:MAG: Crp/Fnr family transcriptional regulator [Saprospiraceae bacterium]
MISLEMLRRQFPRLAHKGMVELLAEKAAVLRVPPGKVLFEPGDPIRAIPLLLSGSVKVSRADASGHEVLLYYIHPGESCAMTLASSLRRENSRVRAVAEQAAELVVIPAELAHTLARSHPAWSDFVLETYSQRFDELLALVEEVSFAQLDQRLIKYLQEKSALLGTVVLPVSHQQIADDLGSARAVVSRLLKQMERKGMVQLLRRRIKVVGLT